MMRINNRASAKISSSTQQLESARQTPPATAVTTTGNTTNKIVSQYGTVTQADTLKLQDTDCIELFRSSRYLSELRRVYPKVSINLNANLKHLYFFGDQRQVSEAKRRVEDYLAGFMIFEFKFNNRNAAHLFQKAGVRRRIVNFLNVGRRRQLLRSADPDVNYISEDYDNDNDNDDDDEDEDEEGALKPLYCSYDVLKVNVASAGQQSSSAKDNSPQQQQQQQQAFILRIYTNSKERAFLLNTFLDEHIRINHVVEINSTSLIKLIERNDSQWSDVYERRYRDLVNFTLESTYKLVSNAPTQSQTTATQNAKQQQQQQQQQVATHREKFFLKLDGFKDDISHFIHDLRTRFNIHI